MTASIGNFVTVVFICQHKLLRRYEKLKLTSEMSVAHRCRQWIKSETMIIVWEDRLYVDGKGT